MDLPRHCVSARRLAIASSVAVLASALVTSQAQSATQSEMIKRCETCHGPGGDSRTATTPRLNGQQAGYIVDRLKKLSAATRNPHVQVGMLKELNAGRDVTIVPLANYFSGQAPTSAKPGSRAAEGQLIFEKGSEEDNVIACNQCHGPKGEGHDTTPRLAGQHGDYLKAQLRLFNLKFRDHVLMKPNTKTMSDRTMDVLISYLAND